MLIQIKACFASEKHSNIGWIVIGLYLINFRMFNVP